jgi:hypothetical protein
MYWIQLLGTVASVIVAISLTMKNIRWLRWVNLVGSALFATYGFLIQAWPVFGLNAFIVVINVVYLVQLRSTQDRFALLEVSPRDSEPGAATLLARFLETHGPDLARFQPEFPRRLPDDARVFFVLREVLPISLFACRPDGQGNQEILVDYSVPAWRDYQNARFMFQDGLRSMVWPGTGTFVARATVASHQKYLKLMGFQPVAGRPDTWSWTLGDRPPR